MKKFFLPSGQEKKKEGKNGHYAPKEIERFKKFIVFSIEFCV